MVNPIRLDVSGLAGIPEAVRRLGALQRNGNWSADDCAAELALEYTPADICDDPVFQEVV